MGRIRKKLGQMLMEAGKINETQLNRALARQRLMGGRLGTSLVVTGSILDEELLTFLSLQTGLPTINLAGMSIADPVLRKIPQTMVEEYNLIPVRFEPPNTLVVAFADPTDERAVSIVRKRTGHEVVPILTTFKCILEGIRRFYLGDAPTFEDDHVESLPVKPRMVETISTDPVSPGQKLEALIRVLERKGLLAEGELAAEIEALRRDPSATNASVR